MVWKLQQINYYFFFSFLVKIERNKEILKSKYFNRCDSQNILDLLKLWLIKIFLKIIIIFVYFFGYIRIVCCLIDVFDWIIYQIIFLYYIIIIVFDFDYRYDFIIFIEYVDFKGKIIIQICKVSFQYIY